MTEFSMPWDTVRGLGDGAYSYDQEQALLFFREFQCIGEGSGVIINDGDELLASGVASPIAVAEGNAFCYGHRYMNTSSLNIAVPTPAVGATGKRIVLRADWGANTVRLTLISSADGNDNLPSLTQTAGSVWDMPICSFVIDTSGDIWKTDALALAGVYDERKVALNPSAGMVLLRRFYATDSTEDLIYFDGVPDDFTNLVLRVYVKSSETAGDNKDTLRILANYDFLTTGDYRYFKVEGKENDSKVGTFVDGSFDYMAEVPVPTSDDQYEAAIGEFTIFSYAYTGSPSMQKVMLGRWGISLDTSFSSQPAYTEIVGALKTTTAIDSFSFEMVDANFRAGSYIELWGVK